MKIAIKRLEENFRHKAGKVYEENGEVKFSVTHSVQYAIFLYLYSNQLYLDDDEANAAKVYYLNKVMNCVEWFYAVKFPTVFSAEHPMGSVVGKAQLADHLFLYQGTTIGGNRNDNVLYYPTIGSHVVMCADSKVLGNSHVGNNVILSANSYVINEDIPDNCIVFGQSPNLTIKSMNQETMRRRINEMCMWRE